MNNHYNLACDSAESHHKHNLTSHTAQVTQSSAEQNANGKGLDIIQTRMLALRELARLQRSKQPQLQIKQKSFCFI